MVRGMRAACVPVSIDGDLLDIVGTGGDGASTINISTAACVLAAACGCIVAKAGNRSVSSLCGSADVLEALGIEPALTPAQVRSARGGEAADVARRMVARRRMLRETTTTRTR